MWDRTKAIESLYNFGAAGLGASLTCLLLARFSGPTEIRDTFWTMLDVEG